MKVLAKLFAAIGLLGVLAGCEGQQSATVYPPVCEELENTDLYPKNILFVAPLKIDPVEGWVVGNGEFINPYALAKTRMPYVEGIAEQVEARGARLAFVSAPLRSILMTRQELSRLQTAPDAVQRSKLRLIKDWYRRRVDRLEDLNIIAPDLFVEVDWDLDSAYPSYMKSDNHWSARGAFQTFHALANHPEIADHLDWDEEQIENAAALQYVPGEEVLVNGFYQEAINTICPGLVPDEPVYPYVEPASDFAAAADLFGDAPTGPKVVLAGTSYSNFKGEDLLNVTGMLKAFFGDNVTNRAIVGGAAYAAMESYLSSDEFHSDPADLLIWEIPASARLGNIPLMQQLIASAMPRCENRRTLPMPRRAIAADITAGFRGAEDAEKFDILIENNRGKELELRIEYQNGDIETILLEKTTRGDRNLRSDIWSGMLNTRAGGVKRAQMVISSGLLPSTIEVGACSAPASDELELDSPDV